MRRGRSVRPSCFVAALSPVLALLATAHVLAAVATARPDVLACRDETIDVLTQDGPMLGRTVVAAAGTRVCVVEEINRQVFEEDLLAAILD